MLSRPCVGRATTLSTPLNSTDGGKQSMDYRRDIDGLRAVAVIPVVLFHAGLSLIPGGFIGVDVFFVISGYLIGSIVISEIGEGCFSVVRFYERRARRIIPAFFV